MFPKGFDSSRQVKEFQVNDKMFKFKRHVSTYVPVILQSVGSRIYSKKMLIVTTNDAKLESLRIIRYSFRFTCTWCNHVDSKRVVLVEYEKPLLS